MNKQPVFIDAANFPDEIRPFLQNVQVYDSSCRSDATVYYLDSGFYLKVDAAGALRREAELAQYFFQKGLGPEPIVYLSEARDYMLTRSADGEDATHHLDNPEKLCAVFAECLRALHAQAVENLPLSSHMQIFMDFAAHPQARNFDPAIPLERFGIRSGQEALQIIEENKGRLTPDTLIHGDACLPNIILKDFEFRSFIDLGMAGHGDKHVDLYWACWSLHYNLQNEKYIDRFLDAYGRCNFEYDMLRVIAAFDSMT